MKRIPLSMANWPSLARRFPTTPEPSSGGGPSQLPGKSRVFVIPQIWLWAFCDYLLSSPLSRFPRRWGWVAFLVDLRCISKRNNFSQFIRFHAHRRKTFWGCSRNFCLCFFRSKKEGSNNHTSRSPPIGVGCRFVERVFSLLLIRSVSHFKGGGRPNESKYSYSPWIILVVGRFVKSVVGGQSLWVACKVEVDNRVQRVEAICSRTPEF